MNWIPLPEPDKSKTEFLSGELKINLNLVKLLVQRGIESYEQARLFFRPELGHLHDPFLMKDMDKAVERIKRALDAGENILIYGDYDADGTTAVALVFSFFRDLSNKINYYIPDRHTEGYGITAKGVEYAVNNNFSLVIALDCGIKSVALVEAAAAAGTDFIICDHHLPGEVLPAAVAVLDPKRNDCSYPFKELSGCGIGYKLIQAYNETQLNGSRDINRYLDILTVSIAADIVQITGENRVLAHYGLKRLCAEPCTGLKALMSKAVNRNISNISDVVFMIGPRINAAGRIADARAAVDLLISADEKEAGTFANLINQHNTERKTFDESITAEALAMISSDPASEKKRSNVLFNSNWHKGVIGIVASRVIEQYYKPTIILTESNGKATGSARSVKGFDVHSAIEACADLLDQYGGHTHAAGLTMKLENVDSFKKRFEEVVSSMISEESLVPQIVYDLEISFEDITASFLKILKQFAPFGPGNMAPVFLTRNVQDAGYGRVLKDKHMKMHLRAVNGGPSFDAIAFGQSAYYSSITDKKPMDILYSIEENEYNGNSSLQLVVKDLRPGAS